MGGRGEARAGGLIGPGRGLLRVGEIQGTRKGGAEEAQARSSACRAWVQRDGGPPRA